MEDQSDNINFIVMFCQVSISWQTYISNHGLSVVYVVLYTFDCTVKGDGEKTQGLEIVKICREEVSRI